jgi:hypothetical protein
MNGRPGACGSRPAATAAVVASAVLAVLVALARQPAGIERPRMGIPAVCRSGGGFAAELRVPLPAPSRVYVRRPRLDDGARTYPLEVSASRTRGGSVLAVLRVPAGTPPGRYALRVGTGAGAMCRSNAVHVVASFPRTFRFVQIADLGVSDDDPQVARRFRETVRVINRIAPAFVLLTGDITEKGSWTEYAAARELLGEIEAPLVCGPANHDRRGWAGYMASFGSPRHAVDFGRWRILSLDSGHGRDRLTRSDLRWLGRGLFLCAAEGKRCIVQVHHPLFGRKAVEGCRREAVEMIAAHFVPAVFSGHWHADAVLDGAGRMRRDASDCRGCRFVVTTSVGQPPRAIGAEGGERRRGFRVVDVRDGVISAMRTVAVDGEGRVAGAAAERGD